MSSIAKMVLIPLERYEELTKKNGKLKEDSKQEKKCDGLTEEELLSFLPQESLMKAKMILRHMKSNEMTWDDCGRLIWGKECILDANVIEVIRDAVSEKKSNIDSPASRHFYKLLLITRFPISLLRDQDGGSAQS